MMPARFLFLLFLLIGSSACTTPPSEPPSDRVTFGGHDETSVVAGSFSLPKEPGWIEQDAESGILLIKEGLLPYEDQRINGDIYPRNRQFYPITEHIAELKSTLQTDYAKDSRITLKTLDVDPAGRDDCVKAHVLAQDMRAPQKWAEGYILFCTVPIHKNCFIQLAYWQNYYTQNRDTELEGKADRLFSTFKTLAIVTVP